MGKKKVFRRYKWTEGPKAIYGEGAYDQSGAWLPKQRVVMCSSGYHVCTREQVAHWRGTELWEVEVRGKHLEANDKECWEEMRFVRKLKWTHKDMVDCAKADAKRILRAAEEAHDAAKGVASGTSYDPRIYLATLIGDRVAEEATYVRQQQRNWIETRIGEVLK